MRKIALILFFTSIIFTSCNEWLNLQPEDGVIREKYWKTKEEVQAAVMGCYASMLDDAFLDRIFVWGELRADFITLTPRAGDRFISVVNGEITETNSYANWAIVYKTINLCNTVLAFAKDAQETDLSFSNELLKKYEAEVTAIRSLMYFYLVKTFKDVPMVFTASLSDDQDYRIPKTDGSAILDSLVVQLRSIENTIPVSYGSSNIAENKGRFTIWGVKALLADIYLWKEDYAQTADLCNQIINSGQFSLIPISREIVEVTKFGVIDTAYYANNADVYNFFNNLYVEGNSEESILELEFSNDKANPLYGMCYPTSAVFNVKMDNISDVHFLSSDIDRGWTDIRTEGVTYKQGIIWKHTGFSQNEYLFRGNGNGNWIFYRLAEIILMRAEALNQLAKMQGENQVLMDEALALVNQIRVRANATDATDLTRTITDGITTNDLEHYILEERAREFTFEGKRWFDVLRHAKRNNYAGSNIDYLLNLTVLSAPAEKASGLQNKFKGDYNSHYWPIYLNELNSNPSLIQNPFYIK